MTINGGGKKSPPPTPPEEGKIFLKLHQKLIFAVLGLVGKGSFNPSQYGRSFATLRTTLCVGWEGVSPSQY